jgi:hypothetical protein
MKTNNLLLIIIIIFIITSSGCIRDDSNNNKNNEENYYIYYVDLKTNTNTEYKFILPILIEIPILDNNGTKSDVMNTLEITGSGNYTFVNTEYGFGIEITGHGNIFIKTEGKSYIPSARLNMLIDSNNDGRINDEYNDVKHYIYFNSTEQINLDLDLSASVTHGTFSMISYIRQKNIKSKGWIKISGYYTEGSE